MDNSVYIIFIHQQMIILGCGGEALINGKDPVRDDQLSASSSENNNHGPSRSRLNVPAQGPLRGAWEAATNDLHQYIQVTKGPSI